MTFPKEFEIRMRKILGDEYESFAASYEKQPSRGLHVNLHKISVRDFAECADFPIGKIGFSPEAFTFDCDKIGNHPLHHAGAFYVQEPTAMIPLAMLDATDLRSRPELRVLDMCASPGGKSSQAANLFAGRGGFLLSNEYVPNRALTLAENIERLGIAPAAVTNLDTGVLANDCAGMFDLTVVDAPCSGEGMFRKNPDAPAMWSTDNVAICAARQSKILSDAAQTVAVGGYLLYSTCTFSVEENEATVAGFLDNFPDFEPVYPDAAICGITDKGISNGKYDMSFCRRAYPHISGGEGQFAALFLRVSGPQSDKKRNIRNINAEKPDKSEEKLIRAFLCETIGDTLAAELAVFGRKDGFYIVDGLACLPSKGVLSPGVKLGEIRKGRVVPHHRFFMAYGKHFINKFEMDRRQAEAYIRGDTVACDRFCGYGAAVFCGCTLGAVKVSDGVAKNHYPKGLRIR